jgi:polysaccharide export outer membrane protein
LKNRSFRNQAFLTQFFPVVTIAFFIAILSSSCGNVKNLQYLQGSFDTARLSKVEISEPIVQKGDLLGITVYSDDPLATAAVTNPMSNTAGMSLSSTGGVSGAAASSSGSSTLQGFIVSQNGEIQLYKLGTIHAEGKTKKQLADTLALLYAGKGLLKNPFVEIRFMSYKISVIGEVSHPGTFSIPTDKLSAFEAIGLAGDITTYGRRDNVLVVREINGVRQFGRLNLKDPNVFLSPFYYLQQNDMVVVDVGKNKSAVNNQGTFQTITVAASLISIAAVLISIFSR